MEIWQAIVLGIVQGLTEFLPISSSGHLIIFPWLFDWETPGLAFDAALHLGTLVAVLIYFRDLIWRMIQAIPTALRDPLGILRGSSTVAGSRVADARMGLLIVVASIPGGIAGLLLEDRIDEFFHTDDASTRAIATIATMLIVVAGLMYLAEVTGRRTKDIPHMKWVDALIVGLAQAVALIPGTSRSGATISAGLFRGLTREDAARFSFLAGVPLVTAAGLKSVAEAIGEGMTRHEMWLFLSGGASAAIVGFLTIWGLLQYLQKRSTMVFIVYRVLFGLFLFLMLFIK
jgi:undecaprenyl-diphosphatase